MAWMCCSCSQFVCFYFRSNRWIKHQWSQTEVGPDGCGAAAHIHIKCHISHPQRTACSLVTSRPSSYQQVVMIWHRVRPAWLFSSCEGHECWQLHHWKSITISTPPLPTHTQTPEQFVKKARHGSRWREEKQQMVEESETLRAWWRSAAALMHQGATYGESKLSLQLHSQNGADAAENPEAGTPLCVEELLALFSSEPPHPPTLKAKPPQPLQVLLTWSFCGSPPPAAWCDPPWTRFSPVCEPAPSAAARCGPPARPCPPRGSCPPPPPTGPTGSPVSVLQHCRRRRGVRSRSLGNARQLDLENMNPYIPERDFVPAI